MLVFIGILLFAGASFFFALSEAALFSLGTWRGRRIASETSQSGRAVGMLLEAPQDFLSTIVLGNTVANCAVVTLALDRVFRGEWPFFWTGAGLLALLLVGCEAVPKTLAIRAPERWAKRIAPLMLRLTRVTKPIRRGTQSLFQRWLRGPVRRLVPAPAGINDEEYRELLEMAFQQGTLKASERDLIAQIITLDRRTAGEVMKPRSQMACIPDDLGVPEMLEAARRLKHRRLPMYDGSPDTIVGVLNTRAFLLNPEGDLVDAIEFPSFVPSSMNLLQLLKSLQRQGRGLAIVLDEYGGTAGIVTAEDILEAMIGEIRAEGQPERVLMERIGPDRWRVGGTVRIDEFRQDYPELREVPGVETVGGLVVRLCEVVPAVGEVRVSDGLRFTVASADDRRVREVIIERVAGGDRRKGVRP